MNTFARTEPPDTQVTKSVIALLLHYGWNKFSIVAEKAWSTVARSLEHQAHENNLTVNHHRLVEDRHTCCEDRMPCCEAPVWFQLIQETKNKTRSQSTFLYVCSGSQETLADRVRPSVSQSVSQSDGIESLRLIQEASTTPGDRLLGSSINLADLELRGSALFAFLCSVLFD